MSAEVARASHMRGSGWPAILGDLLVKTEPLWAIPALAFTCMTLVWGMGWSWVGLLVAASALPLRYWRLGHISRRTPFEIPIALFLVSSLVGLGVSPDRALSLRAFQSVLACVLVYLALVNVPHPGYIKWGFAFAGVGVFVAGLLAFGAGVTPPSVTGSFGAWFQDQVRHLPDVPRLSNIANPIMSSAHGLAIALEMVLLPLAGLALFGAKVSRKAGAALASLPLLSLLLLLGSQGAWLAVAVGVAVLLLWRSRWAVVVFLAVVGLGFVCYRQGWIDPHSLVTQFGPSESLRSRMGLWRWAVDVIRHHPVAGCGLGCLGRYSTSSCLSPHNAYLQSYADVGLVGALVVLAALIAGGRMVVELVRRPPDGPWCGFAVGIVAAAAAVAVHGVFEGSPAGIMAETADGYYYIVSPVVAILAGLFVAAKRITEESHLVSDNCRHPI